MDPNKNKPKPDKKDGDIRGSKSSERSRSRKHRNEHSVRVPPPHRHGMWNIKVQSLMNTECMNVQVPYNETVEGLKGTLSTLLKVPPERLNVTCGESNLNEANGSLLDYGLMSGSKVVVGIKCETGLVSKKPEPAVTGMQSLENLTETQVNDFLNGKCPLTLALKLGDHMMFIQLHLSSTSGTKRSSSSSHHSSTKRRKHHHHHHHHHHVNTQAAPAAAAAATTSQTLPSTSKQAQAAPTISLTCTHPATGIQATMGLDRRSFTAACQSLVPQEKHRQSAAMPVRPPVSHAEAQPITKVPNIHHKCCPQCPKCCAAVPTSQPLPVQQRLKSSSGAQQSMAAPLTAAPSLAAVPSTSRTTKDSAKDDRVHRVPEPSTSVPASLTLPSSSTSLSSHKSKSSTTQQGAIIESMQHLGQGVYSGTFSGTLNPALQDRAGKPKRSINTIIQILNDLLGSSPEYAAFYGRAAAGVHPEYMYVSQRHHRSSASEKSPRKSPTPDSVQEENKALKGKVQQIQQMLQEKKERRKARRAAKTTTLSCSSYAVCRQNSATDSMDTDHTVDVSSVHMDNAKFADLKADNNSGDSEMKQTGAVVA